MASKKEQPKETEELRKKVVLEKRDYWKAIGMNTDPIDWEAAEEAMHKLYESRGYARVPIIRCSSPLDALHKRKAFYEEKYGKKLPDSEVFVSPWVIGPQDAYWNALADAAITLGRSIEEDKKKVLEAYMAYSKVGGWAFPFDVACFMCEKIRCIHIDNRLRPSCEFEPAIGWPDGFGLFAIDGIQVPPYVVLDPQKITIEDITAENNVEIRRLKIGRYKGGADEGGGYPAYIRDAGFTKLDFDECFGVLWSGETDDDEGRPMKILEVTNKTQEPDGSYKRYGIRVHPKYNTARDAWFGLCPIGENMKELPVHET